MKVLILGCRGRLGTELMGAYSDVNPVGWGREDLDVTDEQAVWDRISELKPDLVYNCTGYNDVDKAEEEREKAEAINGYAPGYVAKACKAVGAKLIHYSSGMVFDGQNSEGYAEDDPTHPINAYGRSKLLGEMEAQENADDIYVIRTSWLYGKPGTSEHSKKSFIEAMLEKGKAGGSITVAEDEIGRPTYTLDLAQASRALVEEAREFGVYHIVNTGVASRLDWAREIFASAGVKAELKAMKGNALARMARRPHYEVLNNTKFLELRPWVEALREYLGK